MDDLKNFFCWNKKCDPYGVRGGENIFVRAWYGKNKDVRHSRENGNLDVKG